MRLEGKYLFSPTDEFKDLELANFRSIVEAFERRIDGWFFEPLKKLLVKEEDFFVASAIECILVDTLSGFSYGTVGDTHKEDFVKFLKENFNLKEATAEEFYSRFRCGILHQANIKKGGSLTEEIESPPYIQEEDNNVFFNPRGFCKSLENYFEEYMKRLRVEQDLQIKFRIRFYHLFTNEFEEDEWKTWWTAIDDYEEDIRNSILSLLTTNKGERESDPNFGIDLGSLIFSPCSETQLLEKEKEIFEELALYEQRIEPQTAKIELNIDYVYFTITYEIKATNRIECFVCKTCAG